MISGKAFVIENRQIEITGKKIENTQLELEKLERAFTVVISRLEKQCNSDLSSDEETATIKDVTQATIMLLQDDGLVSRIKNHILAESESAVQSICEEVEKSASQLENIDDEYISRRADDLRAAYSLVIDELLGKTVAEVPNEPVIIVGENLQVTDISSFDRKNILGFVSYKGSANSHLAIVAKNFGVPYSFGQDISGIHTGDWIDLEPTKMISIKDTDILLANIISPKDVDLVLESGAEGIGLFRTEFLYMDKEKAPSEDEQYEIYRDVLERMGDRKVVIRTVDLGADKSVLYLNMGKEENPALGKRGIRYCLEHPEFFRVQLRAILRASVHGNAHIMYPMITSVDEVIRIKEQVELAAQELDSCGLDYCIPKQGIMIETPAAALVSDELAKHADFFSIGSNDLTQYTLACDRQADGLTEYFDAHHEAIYRLIEMTISNAHKEGIRVSICGELGLDEAALPRLLQAGIDEISVAVGMLHCGRS